MKSAESVIEIDPNGIGGPTTTLLPGVYKGEHKYSDCFLMPDVKIYCPPNKAQKVLVIDPTVEPVTETLIDISGCTDVSASNKFYDCALAPSQKLYCLPFDVNEVLEITVL
eukprot:TRINITY_DN20337_c0_g1_i3.p1 TRINITY_DN20337_c0_g1~~TRINITY_DN20337_c0_g1_i3.p1  ORF type:complete len:111 (+),score=15.65 TRINITY_DN20337_c0_g1_i3:554-886(+)